MASMTNEETASPDKAVHVEVEDRDGVVHPIDVPGDLGLNMMEVCKAAGLPVEGICGGIALCGSCHVYVLGDRDTGERTEDEEHMLDQLPDSTERSRLSCQLRADDGIDGLRIRLAPL